MSVHLSYQDLIPLQKEIWKPLSVQYETTIPFQVNPYHASSSFPGSSQQTSTSVTHIPLFYKAVSTLSSYTVLLTDFSRIWYENLGQEDLNLKLKVREK